MLTSPSPEERLLDLERRLAGLEAEKAVRACLTRYMRLCDELDGRVDLDELGALFTRAAVWEGRGTRYGSDFGRHEGRAAIAAFLGSYQLPVPHFRSNAHFLTSEDIRLVDAEHAEGSWLMLQTPTFFDGSCFLMSAQLDIRFAFEDGGWRMARFRTSNLFARPSAPWDQPVALPVPARVCAPAAPPPSTED